MQRRDKGRTGRRAKRIVEQEDQDRNKNSKRGKTAAKEKMSRTGWIYRAHSHGIEFLGLKTPV